MLDITIYGTKNNVQKYYRTLEAQLGASMQLKEQMLNDERGSQVIISIKSDNLFESSINVEGFRNIGLSAKNYVEPYVLKYSKSVGQTHMKVEQSLRRQDNTLGDYEDLESYDIRMGNAYVG